MLLVAAVAVPAAFGSAIIGRDVSHPTLTIDQQGRAHVTYVSGGGKKVLTAWDAINALPPSTARAQVKFKLRYGQGGTGTCLPYDGPALAWVVQACKAPDGSYWALQSWVRLKKNFGGTGGAKELHLSHWSGPLAQLDMYQNWAYGKYRHMFGRLTYDGVGVYGFKATGDGAPLDSYGRNIYVDTFNSRYGKGWHRENSFLTHHNGRTLGDFCYGFFAPGSPARQGDEVPRDCRGPGSHARRDVGGRRHRKLQGIRPGHATGPGAKLGRPEVPHLARRATRT